ncbi:hypothetical protein PMAYCL1PPCAC_12498, partial [Pristionchus mayeri]
SPARTQTGISAQHTRHNRPSQRLLTANGPPALVKVASRKRVMVKHEDEFSPNSVKQKYEESRARRFSTPSHKTRDAPDSITNAYGKLISSNYSTERSFECNFDDEDDEYEEYYDQLPPRLNSPKIYSPIKHKKGPVSIVTMGKSVVTGRKDNISQEIDIQHLIEKYVNSETPMETEAWLINIGLSEKLNSVNREMERMRTEMTEMWEWIHRSQKVKDGLKDRLTMQTPWPGDSEGVSSCVAPTPFGASPAPIPPNEKDYLIPPIYGKTEVDCGEVYNEIQRKGKKRPGVVFLTHFIRNICSMAIEPPHKSLLTIRSKKRKDDLINLSPQFMKPIESFFLAACNVTSGLTYALGDMLRETLANELRELRRTPRKEKVTTDYMMRVLKEMGAHQIPLLPNETGEHGEVGGEEIVEEEREGHHHLEMEEDVEVEDVF